ncbi:MAG: DUF2871 domain-containing protein [Clostridium sp.]
MKKIFNFSFIYLCLGLIFGVFYREFTKINGFEGQTVLASVHTHILVLGFVFLLIVLVLEKQFTLTLDKIFHKWFIVYNVSFIYMIGTLVARGTLEVLGKDMAGLSHIAGLGHALLGVSLIWFMIIVKKKVIK